jgi:phosphoribosylglycinamide formyltransferase-1
VGATVHFVTPELDGGPPVLQASVPIMPDDNPDTLAARVATVEHIIYPLATRWLLEGRLALTDEGAILDGTLIPRTGVRYTTELR